MSNYPKISKLKTAELFLDHLKTIDCKMPFTETVDPAGVLLRLSKPKAGPLEIGLPFCQWKAGMEPPMGAPPN